MYVSVCICVLTYWLVVYSRVYVDRAIEKWKMMMPLILFIMILYYYIIDIYLFDFNFLIIRKKILCYQASEIIYVDK